MAREKKEIQIYEGTMLWNDTNFYAGGKKKMSTGTITMIDTNHNACDYRYVSFRSQVSIQSDALGKNGMKGIKCKVHGYFEENTYQGNTTMQIMVDKLFLEGHEQLAIDAEAAGTPLPPVPAGTLPSAPIQPMVSNGMPIAPTGVQVGAPNIPAPTIPMQTLPSTGNNVPAPIVGGYVMQSVGMVPQPPVAAPQVVQHVAAPQPPVAAPVAAPKQVRAITPPNVPNIGAPIQNTVVQPQYIPAGDMPE